jgi:hypothetical protein
MRNYSDIPEAYNEVMDYDIWKPLKVILMFNLVEFANKDLLQFRIDVKRKMHPDQEMSSLWFFYMDITDEEKCRIHIVLSTTREQFRKRSLNTILRVILCKMAATLNVKVTSNAVNVISGHTLCNLGFEILNSRDNDTCRKYDELLQNNVRTDNVIYIDANLELQPGKLILPEFFDNLEGYLEVLIKGSEDLHRDYIYFKKSEKFVDALAADTLAQNIMGHYEGKTLGIMPHGGVDGGIEMYFGNDEESSKYKIIGIPFKVRRNTVTLLSTFDAESFTGVSMYKLVLCVLCNLCIALGLDMRIYPNKNSGSLESQIESLEGLGFQQEQSKTVMNPLFQGTQDSGVENLAYLEEDIAMVFYSEGKRPFNKNDMDPRLFPDSGEGFWNGGGGGWGAAGGKAPLGGDNAALALFGLFVTVVAAGFSSAKL